MGNLRLSLRLSDFTAFPDKASTANDFGARMARQTAKRRRLNLILMMLVVSDGTKRPPEDRPDCSGDTIQLRKNERIASGYSAPRALIVFGALQIRLHHP